MKTNKLFKWVVTAALALTGLSGSAYAQGNMILVSGTDFTVSSGAKDYWHTVDMVDKFSGVMAPSIIAGGFFEQLTIGDEDATFADKEESNFLDKPHYAVTPNPIRLDSVRMQDNENSGEWGAVFSAGDKNFNANKKALTYKLTSGLKNGGAYKVVVEYCNPLNAAYLKNGGNVPKPHLESSYSSSIKIGVNNTSEDGEYIGGPGNDAKSCKIAELTNPTDNKQTLGKIAGNQLEVNIFLNQMNAGEALMIKSIKIYAEISATINGLSEVCTGGENTVLTVGETFLPNVKIQWCRNGNPIAGANGLTYTHTSGDNPGKYTYTYILTASNGDEVESDPFEVTDVLCCLDPVTQLPVSRKMIWQDDFGTFTAKGKYWTWDYSILDEPQKVEHNTADGWTYNPGYTIPGATYKSLITDEGQFNVAGNVTCKWDDLSGGDGTQWEWQAQCFNGVNPGKNGYIFVPDHTYGGSAYGGMLFLNCGNEPNEVLYSREINNLCDKDLTVKCFINCFSGSDNPVKIKIRVTDLNDDGNTFTTLPVTRYSKTSGLSWKEITAPLKLTANRVDNSAGLRFEIISEVGGNAYNKEGNDLILDDIQVFTCTSPSVQLYFDLDNFAEDTADCDGSNVSLNVPVSKMIETVYGENARYIFQYNPDPTDKYGWVTIGTMQKEPIVKGAGIKEIFDNLQVDDEVYFRVVLGEEATLTGVDYFNPDAACVAYTVSEPIVATKKCPECTVPLEMVLKSSVKAKSGVVELCKGESVTLSTNNIVPEESTWASAAFEGYTFEWYLDDNTTAEEKQVGNNTESAASFDVPANPGVTDDEVHTWLVKAYDSKYPTTPKCTTTATIKVKYLKTPVIEDETFKFCFGKPAVTDKLPTTNDGKYDFYEDADTATSVTIAAFDELEPKKHEYYYVWRNAAGCSSEPKLITINVGAIPSLDIDAPEPFCAKTDEAQKTLPTTGVDKETGDALTITWDKDADLSKLEGSTDPIVFNYVLKNDAGCETKDKIEITAKPTVEIKLFNLVADCGDNYLVANVSPADADKKFTLTGNDGVEEELSSNFADDWNDKWKEGTLKLEASLEPSYCSSSESIEVATRVPPTIFPSMAKATYIKRQQAKEKVDLETRSAIEVIIKDEAHEKDKLKFQFTTNSYTTADKTASLTDADFAADFKAPIPQAANVASSEPETLYYYCRIYNELADCYSPVMPVEVVFYGAPVPLVHDSVFCKGSNAGTLADYATPDNSEGEYELKFYDANGDPVPATTVPSTSAVGEVSYFVSQWNETNGESEPLQEVKIKTVDVKDPSVTDKDFEYCLNENKVEFLSATKVEDADRATGFYWSDGVEWSSDGTTYSSDAIKPASTTAETKKYYARQYVLLTSGERCESKPSVEFTVDFQETSIPTSGNSFSVAYLYSELEANGAFSDILTEDPQTVLLEDGYKYYFATCSDENGSNISSWGETPLAPANVTKEELAGGTKTVYMAVKRKANDGAGCWSDSVIITITISDSPVPTPVNQFFCEGETIESLDNYVTKNAARGKSTDDYDLLWYGTTKPGLADMANGSTNVSDIPVPGDISETYEVTYYVAQKDKGTDAIGAAVPLKITVYPNPDLKINDPEPVCETSINFKKTDPATVEITNEFRGPNYVTRFFTDEAAQNEMTGPAEKSGIYYTQVSYEAMGSKTNSVCKSKVEPIKVTIDELEISRANDSITCPDTKGYLTAAIETNVSKAKFEWSAQNGTSGTQTDNDVLDGKSKFESKALPGIANDVYLFDLKVTAGSCTESKTGIKITLGDGPVEGTLTLAEANNTMSGKAYSDNSRDVTSDPFFMCGDGVSATADFVKDATSEFKWVDVDDNPVSASAITKPGVYYVKYSNKCATSVKFEIKDASIKDNMFTISSKTLKADENSAEQLSICEKEPLDFNLKYITTKSDEFSIVWTKNGASTEDVKNDKGSIAYSKPENSGEYKYVITNKGCSVDGKVSVQVKPYIKFTPENDFFIARRDSELVINIDMEVPTTTPDVEWLSENKGSVVSTDEDYTYKVKATDVFKVHMSGNDFCPADTTIRVVMDGRLTAETQLDEKMCKDDKAYLIIDTTGTGNLYYKNLYSVVVYETVGDVTRELSDSKRKVDTQTGIISYEVSPRASATYLTKITYREGEGVDEQVFTVDNEIEILQPASWTYSPDYAVCAGDELQVDLTNIKPVGAVTIEWDANADITSTADSSVVVAPVYDEVKAKNHKVTKRYAFTVKREGCVDRRDSVPVKVWEPIVGSMNDTIICEGFGVRLNATNYQANTYEWTTAREATPIAKTATAYIEPEVTAFYVVHMTRGVCELDDSLQVQVNSKPVFQGVDSTGIHQLTVAVEAMSGTSPFEYRVDNGEWVSDNILDSVAYHHHVIYVKDAAGCLDTTEYYLNPPIITIPIWFSPNGDQTADRWEVPSISETYPSAEIKIFDRWGKLLVRYNGSDPGWDGKYNGQDMPSTDYWYEIHVREIDKTYTGHFTLLRR